MSDEGIYGKYIIKKADGSPIDPHATYFILRLDTDEAARLAIRTYAEHIKNAKLAEDLIDCVDWLDDPPPCNCGGRDKDIQCPFHDGYSRFRPHPVWEHGGEESMEDENQV